MLNELNERRIGAIIHLLEHLKGNQIGRKSIQKLVYFLQEVGVDLSYRYKMHYYGPYCSELSYDLGIMDVMGTINVEDGSTMYGYSITLGKTDYKQASNVQEFLDSHQDSFDKLLNVFRGYSAKELELYATMHFVERILKGRGQDSSEDPVMQQVKILKPKHSTNEIEEAYKYLLDNSMIGQNG